VRQRERPSGDGDCEKWEAWIGRARSRDAGQPPRTRADRAASQSRRDRRSNRLRQRVEPLCATRAGGGRILNRGIGSELEPHGGGTCEPQCGSKRHLRAGWEPVQTRKQTGRSELGGRCCRAKANVC
jgi:hypothetical protein